MSIKLRELIRGVRACKTSQEERAVISKECALIRTAFKDNNIQFRHRNVAKLLYIHMLGYPSHFGQMECLKLIASPNFPEKRIGYLALMLLLNETAEVLTLVTNSIKQDLSHPNQYIVGLALTSLGNLATGDMGRNLLGDTERCLRGPNPFIKKKAALVMVRIFKRVPEMIEEFADKIVSLMKDRTHGVLIAGVQLMITIVEVEPEQGQTFIRLVPHLVRLLKNLLTMGYSPEHDVAGITDPFLQVKLLRLLQLLGQGNEEASEAMNDILAQVATNTETAKNAGNAILYECVKAIMTIEAESALRVLAVNILGRFLLNRDNNIRYVALNTLSKVVGKDMDTVQRHRTTIVDCLKDPDVSIRQRALELIYQLTNSKNVIDLMREMLNYLVVASTEQKVALCSKIMNTVDKYAPSRRWQVDTLITMLSIAGNACDESIAANTVMYITVAEELHGYIVHHLFRLLEEDISQVALVHVAVWCFGEYGHLLLQPVAPMPEDAVSYEGLQASQVADMLEKIKKSHLATSITRSLLLTAFVKLSQRLRGGELPRILGYIESQRASMDMELQQRACEFATLLDSQWDSLRPMALEQMPAMDEDKLKAKRAREATADDGAHNGSSTVETITAGAGAMAISAPSLAVPGGDAAPNLLDLDDIFGGGGGGAPQPAHGALAPGQGNAASAPPPAATDLLADIFSAPPAALAAPAAPAVLDPFGGALGSVATTPPATTPQPAAPVLDPFAAAPTPVPATPVNPVITAFEKAGLKLTMELSKPNPADPQATELLCTFTNSTPSDFSNLVFQAAVPKFVTMNIQPPSGSVIPSLGSGSVTQVISVRNTQLGVKTLMLRMIIRYESMGSAVEEKSQVSSFPAGY